VMVGQEADSVAVRAAAEAVVKALVVVDREARRFLVVERAASLPLSSGSHQLHRRGDDRRQHGSSAKLVQEGGREGHCRKVTVLHRDSRARKHARPSYPQLATRLRR